MGLGWGRGFGDCITSQVTQLPAQQPCYSWVYLQGLAAVTFPPYVLLLVPCCCLFAYGVGSFCHSVAVCFGNAVLARGCIFDMLPIESAGISKCFALGMFTTCICVLYSIRPACCMLPHGL